MTNHLLTHILKTEDIIKILPGENLATALSKLTTSHDAAFVFTADNRFLGVINPYYDLIKSSFPGNAKVEHCLFHPPKIYTSFSLSKVAELLIESKVHYLPVFDQTDHFIGIVSARRILSQFHDSPLFHIRISDAIRLKSKSLIKVEEDEPVTNAIHIFKNTKVSKLIVVNRQGKLKGILTYYDLISYLISPRNAAHRGEREGNKVSFYHMKVKNFAKTFVLTLTPEHLLSEALQLIIDKRIGSIVVIDQKRHPIGIVTTRDFLRLLIREEKSKRIQVIGKNLSLQSRQIVGGFFNYLSRAINRKPDTRKARLFIQEEKRGGLFKVALSVFPKRGQPLVIAREGKNLVKVLRKIKRD